MTNAVSPGALDTLIVRRAPQGSEEQRRNRRQTLRQTEPTLRDLLSPRAHTGGSPLRADATHRWPIFLVFVGHNPFGRGLPIDATNH